MNFEGEGESRRVMVSGDATRFPRMHLFLQLEGLGFTGPEDGEEDRYALFCVSVGVDMCVHAIQN